MRLAIRITPIEAGKILGTVAYPIMELHGQMKPTFTTNFGVNLMKYYEFVSDRSGALGLSSFRRLAA